LVTVYHNAKLIQNSKGKIQKMENSEVAAKNLSSLFKKNYICSEKKTLKE